MPQKQSQKKKGRGSEKGKRYQSSKTRERNKVKHVLQSSGIEAAEEYATKYGFISFLREMALYQRKKNEANS